MKVDILDIITPNQQLRSANFALAGSHPSITYLGTPDENGVMDLVYMKDIAGRPWDWLKVGSLWVREILTELKWTQYNTGKLEAPAFGGARRLPRFIDIPSDPLLQDLVTPLVYQFTVGRPETDYIIYDSVDTSGTTPGVPIMVNNVIRQTNSQCRNSIVGPFPSAAVDDLPAGEDWQLWYERDGKPDLHGKIQYGTREVIYCRRGIGRYGWDQFSITNGVVSATPVASSRTTKHLALAAPVSPRQNVF
jgi:hypothetical protein